MNREDIDIMWNKALQQAIKDGEEFTRYHFAALVAAAAVRETSAEYRLGWNDGQMMEREACAKVVEASPSYDWHRFAGEAAAAIRARGQA